MIQCKLACYVLLISSSLFLGLNEQITAQNTPVTFRDASELLVTETFSGVTMGVADMNGDGKDDIIRFDKGQFLNIEYQTAPGQRFLHRGSPIISNEAEWGNAIADYNSDGLNDIIIGGAYDNIKLITNVNGDDSYQVTNINNSNIFMQGCNFVDIDNDGSLDIFACNDDGDSREFRNNGSGFFAYSPSLIDTKTVPESDNSGAYSSVWTDYDNDNDLDLYISKCRAGVSDPTDPRRINMLFENDGDSNFTEVAADRGIAIGAQTWCSDFADIDNDGDMDLFIANHFDNCQLFINDGSGNFTDITEDSGLLPHLSAANQAFAIQAMFRDFNNDGLLDLIITGSKQFLFYNQGGHKFQRAANPFGSQVMESMAVGDLNHDGNLDIFCGYAKLLNEPSEISDKVFLNNGADNNFLAVQLEGVESNRSAIGARLEIFGRWGRQIREVRSGESYGISNSLTQHFGLGNANRVDRVVINWPSGLIQVVNNPAINQYLQIKEVPSCLGQTCNDADPCTVEDMLDENCNCVGTFMDSDNDTVCDYYDTCPGEDDTIDLDNDGTPDACDDCDERLVGTACDDGDDCTIDDAYDTACNCRGALIDSDFDGICDADDSCPDLNNNFIGALCDDGNVCTIGERWDTNCNCTGGIFVDNDNDGYCVGQDPDENDPCIPDSNSASCNALEQGDCVSLGTTSFENNQMGIWQDGGSSARLIPGSNYSNTGDYSFYIQDNNGSRSSFYTLPMDLSFYDELFISFSVLPIDVEQGDRFELEISTNGTYSSYESYVVGQNIYNQERSNVVLKIANVEFTIRTSLRFRSATDNSSDYFVFDDISLEGCVGISNSNCVPGSTCDDNNPCTVGDAYDDDCNCIPGTYRDTDGDGVCDAVDMCSGLDDTLIGKPCDDNNECTAGEVYDNSCGCSGGVYIDGDGDGYCIGVDIDDQDPCIPDVSAALCQNTTTNTDCTQISKTNFENGYMDIWRKGGNFSRLYNATQYANSGSYSYYLQSDQGAESSLYSANLDLSAYDEIVLSFHLYAFSMEENDQFHIEYKQAGEYITLRTLTSGIDFSPNEKLLVRVEIRDLPKSNATSIRFRSECNSTYDYVILDDIGLEGCISDNSMGCIQGANCNDNDPCTAGEYYDSACNCVGGYYLDADNDGYCTIEDPNDNDPCIPDEDNENCNGDDGSVDYTCDVISTVDFEKNNLGLWNDGGQNAQMLHSTTLANSGFYLFYINGDLGSQSSLYSDPLRLAGYEAVRLTFNYFPYSMEDGDKFHVEIALNGSYFTYKTYTAGVDFSNEERMDVILAIEGITFTNNTLIRFRSESTEDDDYVMLDDIIIEKCSSENNLNENSSESRSRNTTTATDQIKLYPNPATGFINLINPLLNDNSEYRVDILDMNGRLIRTNSYSEPSIQIGLDDLSRQIYFFRIIQEGTEPKTFRVLVN